MPFAIVVPALVAVLVALFAGLVSPAGSPPSAAVVLPVALFALAAVAPVAFVSASPLPDAATLAVAAVVDGLPSCAQPVMSMMVLRAPVFGCENADGTPDVACLCRNRPFKTLAKGGVRAGCPADADIGVSREWAIARCTAALTADQGVSRLAAADISSPAPTPFTANGTALPVGGSVTTPADAAVAVAPVEVTNSTRAQAVAIFDLDDDEDQTSGSRLVGGSVVGGMLLAAVVAGGALLL